MHVLKVCASDVGKFAGLNPYTTEDENARAFWRRNAKVARALGKHVPEEAFCRTNVERVILQSSSEERASVGARLGTTSDAASLIKHIQSTVVSPAVSQGTAKQCDAALATTALAKEGSKLGEAIEQDVRLQRGTKREHDCLEHVQRAHDCPVVDRNKVYLHARLLETTDAVVELVGFVDGVFEDTGHVVEVKQRRNRLFGRVVPYEKAQVHCYMVLTGTRRALLCERFDDESMEHWIDFDDAFWEESVLGGVRTFVTRMLEA